MTEFFLVYLILIVGSCLQSVIGFGLGLLSAPLVYFLMPELVPGPMILNALLLTSLLSVKHRGEIDLRMTGYSIAGGTAGVLIAGSVLTLIDAHEYQLLFGISILIAVALSAIGIMPKVSMFSNLIAAMFSGFMGTTTSAGGAPMGLLYQSKDPETIKANLSIFFVYINFFGISVLWWNGKAGHDDLELFLKCAPALIAGWALSFFISKKLNEKVIRLLILMIATLSALLLIVFDSQFRKSSTGKLNMQGAQLVDVVDCRCILGEGAFYSAGRQEIIWVDIQGCNIHTLHWQTRKHQTYNTGSRICWLKECENGNFIAGFEDKICLLTPAFLTKTVLWTLPANAKNIRLNDAKVDRTGRLFFGTMDDLEVSPVGQLLALGSDGGVKTVQQDFIVSNGPAFSPCGQFMYSVSSAARTIYRLKLNASGNYSEAEVFIRFTEENGFPDGITVDAENNIWVAGWDGFGVFKFSQQGRLLEKLSMDVPKVTSVAFAGPDMKHIAVTSARKGVSSDDLNNWPGSGNLFIYSVPVTGISEPYIIN